MSKKKRIVVAALLVLAAGLARGGWALAQDADTAIPATYEELKKKHEALLVDYRNVLAQAKVLLPYKNKSRSMEEAARQFDLQKEQWAKEREAALAKIKELQEKLRSVDEKIVGLTEDRDEYKKSFEKATVENIIGEETKKKIEERDKEIAELKAKVADLQDRIKGMEEEGLKKAAEAELFRRQAAELKTKYAEAQEANRGLEKELDETPKRIAELARENKVLIKRSATMHYNLGVFYTQNKEFPRAAAEFEKAAELDPTDASSRFNLGYIYAEHLQDREKAVGYFQEFLRLAKKDDKDVDWVKRYILTWQSWDGNIPIK